MTQVWDSLVPLTEYYLLLGKELNCGLRVDATFSGNAASGPMIYEFIGIDNGEEAAAEYEEPDVFSVIPEVPSGTVVEWLINADCSGEMHWMHNPATAAATSRLGTHKVGKRSSSPVQLVSLSERIADNDLAELERLLRARGHGKGFTDKQIAAAEKKRKVTFPPELRLFFSLVKEGEVLGDSGADTHFAEVRDGLTAGTGSVGNIVDPVKRWGREDQLPVMPAASSDDIVQPAYASRGWIAFADDGGGNAYAVDLVPGPRGAIGQIVQFDHERDEPPLPVAESLTAFLRGDIKDPTQWGSPAKIEARVFHADKATGTHLSPENAMGAVELNVGHSSTPLDLNLLAGSHNLSTLWFSPYMNHEIDNLSALTTLTALQDMEAPESLWAQVVEQNAFPPNLVTATFSDSRELPLQDAVDIASAVRAHYGLAGLELVKQRIDE